MFELEKQNLFTLQVFQKIIDSLIQEFDDLKFDCLLKLSIIFNDPKICLSCSDDDLDFYLQMFYGIEQEFDVKNFKLESFLILHQELTDHLNKMKF